MEDGEMGMLDVAASCAGGYPDVVVALSTALQAEARRHAERLNVVVVGHGGRDTNCSLAVIEAASRCSAPVLVRVLTCSWPDDSWEPVLQQYVASLQASGACGNPEVEVEVLKFGEEPEELMRRLLARMHAAHFVVQCEQGADLFVDPRSEWLQDNFEDYMVHACCLSLAKAHGVPVWLLQTNADLDLCRGIDAARVRALLGTLQTQVFGKVAVEFPPGARQDGADLPSSFLDLCQQIATAKDKLSAFRALLGLDLDGPASAHGNLYTRFMCYAARATDAPLPVAGVLELVIALRKGGHVLPWSCGAVPDPQWVFAQCLLPPGVAVLTEIHRAEMDTSPTYAAFLGRWMAARHMLRSPRTHGVPAHCRHAGHWWSQLELGRRVATAVRQEQPALDLWADGPATVTAALERLGRAAMATEELESHRLAQEQQAKAGQPTFGTLSPLFRWVQPHLVHVLDFSLRLLSAADLDAEFEVIGAGLPQRPAVVKHAWQGELHAQLLADALAGSPPA